MEGYIKLFRKLLDWEWYDNINTRTLFLHVLVKANYRDTSWHGISIPAGSFITSEQTLMDENKQTRREIRTALSHLKSTNDITTSATKTYTMINVVNWAKYQGDEITSDQAPTNRATNDRPSTDQAPTIAKEIKNERSKEVRSKEGDLLAPIKHQHGEYKNVMLTDNEYTKLKAEISDTDAYIEDLSAYIEGKGVSYKSHYAVIRKWKQKDVAEGKTRKGKPSVINGKPDATIPWLGEYMEDIRRTS